MKKIHFLSLSIIILFVFFCFFDRKVFMKERVLRHNLWCYDGEYNTVFTSEFLETNDIIKFEKDTMIFDHGKPGKDTLILISQYFNTMTVMDPKTEKQGKYSMKGANWTNYVFKSKK